METIFKSLVIILISIVILALPVQFLWNTCLVPAIDGINQISFWQALGLSILFSILFKPSINVPSHD